MCAGKNTLLNPGLVPDSFTQMAFVRTKRNPTPENPAACRSPLEANINKTGCIDVSRLVCAAHLSLVEEAYRPAATACLGPIGTARRQAFRAAVRTAVARRVLDGNG
jgi:hypothetical protein